ncbi:hypothetical protein F5Y07DRAFT_375777 [Xylaria sp. FL0933]|nr:hypothetical protein F5Y07DRAFT_375777 [Xylaria sp. FL0933]
MPISCDVCISLCFARAAAPCISFRKYGNDQGPFGITFRFRTAIDIYFALGHGKETLNKSLIGRALCSRCLISALACSVNIGRSLSKALLISSFTNSSTMSMNSFGLFIPSPNLFRSSGPSLIRL